MPHGKLTVDNFAVRNYLTLINLESVGAKRTRKKCILIIAKKTKKRYSLPLALAAVGASNPRRPVDDTAGNDMDSLLKHMVDMTGHRDHTMLDVSVISAVQELAGVARTRILGIAAVAAPGTCARAPASAPAAARASRMRPKARRAKP
jgi:hypothetical protein